MGKYIGIDLGTTFSVAAYIDADGNPQIVSNQEGDRITASAVYLRMATQLWAGMPRKRACWMRSIL